MALARTTVSLLLLSLLVAGAAIGYWWNVYGRSQGPGMDSRQVALRSDQDPWFTEITQSSGLQFVHDPGPPWVYFFPQIMVTGGALFDYDLDGDLDVYLINSGAIPGSGAPTAVNQLFQQQPDGTFRDVTADSGLGDRGYGIGVGVGDVNNDGYPDVYVTNYGADRLFLNLKNGSFHDITEAAGIENERWGASVCFLDYDRDGWLDLYVTNYVDYFPTYRCVSPTGQPDFCSPSNFAPTADRLWRNATGDRAAASPSDHESDSETAVRFVDVSASSGIAATSGPGLGVTAADFNGDGWLDLYVANDGAANFMWINQQNGTFLDQAVLLGCAFDHQGRSQAGMGIAVGDVDGDQQLDLFVTHQAAELNALYMADGIGGFDESSAARGLGASSYSYTGFGTSFFDVELDGDLDLAIVNGRVVRPRSVPEAEYSEAGGSDAKRFWNIYAEANQLMKNDGRGMFTPHLAAKDDFLLTSEVSRGLCAGDIDNDGDIDLLVTNTASLARLYRNIADRQGHWLRVDATLPAAGGRFAYGARITVQAGQKRWIQDVNPATSFLCANDPRVHFGLGGASQYDGIEVRWPDGSVEWFEGGSADRVVPLQRGKGKPK